MITRLFFWLKIGVHLWKGALRITFTGFLAFWHSGLIRTIFFHKLSITLKQCSSIIVYDIEVKIRYVFAVMKTTNEHCLDFGFLKAQLFWFWRSYWALYISTLTLSLRFIAKAPCFITRYYWFWSPNYNWTVVFLKLNRSGYLSDTECIWII